MKLFNDYIDYSGQKILIGLSGGINSAAILCFLAEHPREFYPKELHLFYAHFSEHSPDTYDFVQDLRNFAVNTFPVVHYAETQNSVLDYFEGLKMIPHPTLSPCTHDLKIKPMKAYFEAHKIDRDLVGYVREERRRLTRMAEKNPANYNTKGFPIATWSNEECFDIVRKHIGWYPKIYDIRENGKRVFKHNNCLPCKNMGMRDFAAIKKHYPEYWNNAMRLTDKLKKFWGRDSDAFNAEFGDHFGLDGSITCEICTI